MNCWRKSGRSITSLHQDVPIEPGMMVYYLHPDRSIERLIVAGENLSWWEAFCQSVTPLTWLAIGRPMSVFYYAENTYVTEDAAVEAYKMQLTEGEKASFWARVRKESPTTDCWLWEGEVDPEGHGLFKWGKWTYKAHEVAHELVRVQWPVVPHCGNKKCCNPGHMADARNGTPMQNNDETKLRDHHCAGQ